MDGIIISLYAEALRNQIFELVMVAIVIDTVFGVLRAIKERNSIPIAALTAQSEK